MGTVLLLAGEHKTDETVEITKSLTLTAEPGAVWISNANPAIAVHANDVTISNLVLKSADPTATAIVSGSPVTLKQPSHRVTVVSNQIEGFVSGILHVYGDGFIARDNQIIGVEVALNAFESDTAGILNAMGSDAIIEGNQISGFFDGIFLSGSHGRVQGNRIRRVNVGIFMCHWNLPVVGEPEFYSDLIPNNAANYWDVNGNEISDGIQMPDYLFEYPVWGINVGSGGTGTNHNLIYGNHISGFTEDIVLLGQLTPFEPLFGLMEHKSYENVIIANPGQVLESMPDDPGPSFGNVLVGIRPMDEAGIALWQDVLANAGPRAETTPQPEGPPSMPSDKIVGTIPIGAGPFGVTVNPYTRVAVTSNTGDGTASVIDLTTLKVTDTIEIGGAPSGPDINPYTNIAVFANEVVADAGLGENHVVSIVDLTTGEVKKHIPVGEESFPVCVNIDSVRNIVVVPLMGKNEVLVIDLETEEIIHTIPVGVEPMCMHWCINPYTNQAVVANMGENTLSVLDLEQGVEIQKIPVGAVPVGASLNPYTNIAVVPNLGSNDVSVVDLTKGEVITIIPVGAEPNCSVIEPTMNLALVSNSASDTVSIIDLNTMSVVDTITVGVYPGCLAIDEVTMTALVTNTNSNDLTIIDLKKVSTAMEDYSRTFFLQLESGLNMISLPLKSITRRTARDLMNEIGSTIAIKLDTKRSRFVGFTETDVGDGFPIEGGQGYIVNVKDSKVVPFVGAAWTNEPPVEAAPSLETGSAWAFVVSGALNLPDDKLNSDGYTIQTRNLRTNAITTDLVYSFGYFALAFADLSRKSIIQADDRLEITARDSSGNVVSRVVRTIDADNIRNAYLNVNLKLSEMIPSQTVLLQNYPNPFNPETWIPYQL